MTQAIEEESPRVGGADIISARVDSVAPFLEKNDTSACPQKVIIEEVDQVDGDDED